jgi:hypothetical protein
MIFDFFKNKPVVEPSVHEWIVDTYSWAISQFNGELLKHDAQLILPTNEFYPGRVSSVHEMAERVFEQTVKYAGMQNWPLTLVEPQYITNNKIPSLSKSRLLRGDSAHITVNEDNVTTIEIGYNPAQVNQPQDLVSSFVQVLATLLVSQSPTLPPGGKDYVPQAIDLLACFMGFGVIFSNTAFQYKGGCGTCNNRQANRQSTLTELETVYSLAMFCVLKQIDKSKVLIHLKAHLKSTFKQSYKQIKQQQAQLEPTALLSLIK